MMSSTRMKKVTHFTCRVPVAWSSRFRRGRSESPVLLPRFSREGGARRKGRRRCAALAAGFHAGHRASLSRAWKNATSSAKAVSVLPDGLVALTVVTMDRKGPSRAPTGTGGFP